MYKGVPYRERPVADVAAELAAAARDWPDAARVFLADGDVMALPFPRLRDLLASLNAALPRLARVSSYANGDSILARTDAELRELRSLKLHTLYMGLESGDDAVLRAVRKRETAAAMVAAGQRAQACGLRMSVMVLIGLGGRVGWCTHAAATADAVNRMQPRLLSALRVIPVPGTPLAKDAKAGRFQMLTEVEAVTELRALVAGLELTQTVFRANHASNIVPLEGRFPKDKPRLLAELDALLASGDLDARTPGRMPLWM